MSNARFSAEIIVELLVAVLAFSFWATVLSGDRPPPRRVDTPVGYQGP